MLATLRIKNLALVPDLTLDLGPEYNVITGETGAGKSMIIGALNLILGERADRNLIRAGADACAVEAVFDLKKKMAAVINRLLEVNGLEPCYSEQLVLKRSFSANGANRQFINSSPTTLGTLKDVGELLVDMHGPHEHQSLLHPSRQLSILDAFGGLEPLRDKVAQLFATRAELARQKAALIVDERSYAQQLDLLQFQVREITGANLRAEEEAELESDYQRASNAARLIELGQIASEMLNGEEGSLLAQSGHLGRTLQDIAKLDSGAMKLADLHQQAIGPLQDLQRELAHYVDKLEIDPARLGELSARIDLVKTLKRKYGATLQEVIDFGNGAAAKLAALQSRDAELARLNGQISVAEKEISRAAHELSLARRKVVPKLSKAVVTELQDLGFKQSNFSVQLTNAPGITATGNDQLEFLFAPNPGEPERPLRAIGSSGELARVMLALKTVLAAQDEIPVLVFDEVDANVGGETATAVGEKMREIGQKRQVLCITHLAPVAAAAQQHYVVTKEGQEGRTISKIKELELKDRVSELARMLGGQFEAARKHAEALLKFS
jgi:DNA repair protein RecN (Recombination protein N)